MGHCFLVIEVTLWVVQVCGKRGGVCGKGGGKVGECMVRVMARGV